MFFPRASQPATAFKAAVEVWVIIIVTSIPFFLVLAPIADGLNCRFYFLNAVLSEKGPFFGRLDEITRAVSIFFKCAAAFKETILF